MLPILLLAISIICVIIKKSRSNGLTGLAILAFFWLITYTISIQTNGELSVARTNLKIMSEVVQKINEIAIVQNVSGGQMIGGVENMQQSQKASDALIAYRDKAIIYNELIGKRKVYRNNWIFFRYWITSLPEGVDVFELNIPELEQHVN